MYNVELTDEQLAYIKDMLSIQKGQHPDAKLTTDQVLLRIDQALYEGMDDWELWDAYIGTVGMDTVIEDFINRNGFQYLMEEFMDHHEQEGSDGRKIIIETLMNAEGSN